MIEVTRVTKTFRHKCVLNNVSLAVPNGAVTGFVGPNGAGKSTLMRIIMGLEKADSGKALINNEPISNFRCAMKSVGALLETSWVFGRRSARAHLNILAVSQGISFSRVDQMLQMAGLFAVANEKINTFSKGMKQRLGIAAAMLGDPENLLFDEPINGLDPNSVLWMRNFVRQLSAAGKAVFISSHLLSEVSQIADQIVVIDRGRILLQSSLADLLAESKPVTLAAAADMRSLAQLLQEAGAKVGYNKTGLLEIEGLSPMQVNEYANKAGILLSHLQSRQHSLEEKFLELTQNKIQYKPDYDDINSRRGY